MAPKIVDKEKKKREIALKAMELFIEEGIENTTISQIAEYMEIGKGTVYEYFTSKDDLINEAIVVTNKKYSDLVQSAVNDFDEPENRFQVFVNTIVYSFTEDVEMLKMFLMISPYLVKKIHMNDGVNNLCDMFVNFREILVEIIQDGVNKGVFKKESMQEAEMIAINTIAFIDGIGMHALISKNAFDLRKQLDFYVENILAYIRV